MSSSVGHNSMVMATGTAASRITGQVRTILLAAALGTTGLAANAYQAGSQIPQVIYTLVSGGIFNAVLVPQIVRTLKSKDAQEQLNKLITFAIVLLLAVTGVVAALTPALTRLYVNGGSDMLALSTAFTFWCVPQIFFYGLYTVVGQILAAKDHFGMYAWSSVGANVISCVGFTVFILMFGKADKQPLGFWTEEKIALTAGTWTLGVAFQALVLFLPLFKLGIHYRPRLGVHGIGLRQMGPVAAWSLGIVVMDQLTTIINTRVSTSAPLKAHEAYGTSLYEVAGNATYQNAFTIYVLPYSLIAVSVATAIFPRIAQFVADRDVDSARVTLSRSLRNVWLVMCFFTAAFVVMPVPISLALLPSISLKEALLMSGPLVALALGLPLSSLFLIIQRTFYAFEDGYHPFLFVTLQYLSQIGILLLGTLFIREEDWVTLLGMSITASYMVSCPALIIMLRRRFDGHIDGTRVLTTSIKAIVAGCVAAVGGLAMRNPVYSLFGAYIHDGSGHMSWIQSIGVCIIQSIVVILLYVGTLLVLRTPELSSSLEIIKSRIANRGTDNRKANRVTRKESNEDIDGHTTAVAPTGIRQARRDLEEGSDQDHALPPEPASRKVVSNRYGRSTADERKTDREASAYVPASMPPSFAVSSAAADSRGSGNAPQRPSAGDIGNRSIKDPNALNRGQARNSRTSPVFGQTSGAAGDEYASGAHASTTPSGNVDSATPDVNIELGKVFEPALSTNRTGTDMELKSQDIVIDRYMLISPLRRTPGFEAWRVLDTVLDQDRQLFVITDTSITSKVEAIASSLALSTNNRFTKVSSMQYVHKAAVLVTQMESGVTLSDCLGTGSGHGRLDFQSMRLITMQVTEGLRQLLSDGIALPTLTTDMIRIGTDGIQIADAPVSPMFIDLLHTPKMDAERTAIYQTASLLYAMITDRASADIPNFDLEQLPEDTPEEFSLICQRGLDVVYLDHSSSISLVSLSELMTLLGSSTTVRGSNTNKLLRTNAIDACGMGPGEQTDADATIERTALRQLGASNALPITKELIAHLSGETGTADGEPESSQDSNDPGACNEPIPSIHDPADDRQATGHPESGGAAERRPQQTANATARTFRSVISGKNNGLRTSGDGQPTQGTRDGSDLADSTSDTAGLDFHDIAAAEMAQAFKPVDAFADNSLFPGFRKTKADKTGLSGPEFASRPGVPFTQNTRISIDQNAGDPVGGLSAVDHDAADGGTTDKPGNGLPESAMDAQSMKHDSTREQAGAKADSEVEAEADETRTGLPLLASSFNGAAPEGAQNDFLAFQATSRIPIFTEAGTPIRPGEESARALIKERDASRLNADGALPPSFTPASQVEKVEEFTDSPALKHKTTKIIVVVLVALLLIAALGFAMLGLVNHSSGLGGLGQQNSQSGPWPKIDVNKVPFKGNKDEEGSGRTEDTPAKPKPAPQPENTTPYTIASQSFIDNTDGQQGYGYHIHLNQPQPVSRFVITIRSSGGNAQLMANTNKPTSGQKVAQFSFDQSGTTEVKLKQKVTTQDLLVWVPINSLPGNSFWVEKVQVF